MSPPRLSVRTTGDGLAAFATVVPGPPMSGAEVDREFERAGVTYGFIAEIRARLAEGLTDPGFALAEVQIATGVAAVPGQDARIELAFAEGIQAGHRREDGSVDYHDRDLLKPVCSGEVLAMVHPALPGLPGTRIDGTSIPPGAPRELALVLLEGTTLGPDNLVRAARDGVVLYRPGQSLDVVDHLVHQGPVDLHSGNLHMQGSLVVKGDVLRPFLVEVTGDVEIRGNVGSGTVRALGRAQISGGVRGGDGGSVCADGDVTLHHAEMAVIFSGGQLRIHESINSQLTAAMVHVTGRLRGGCATGEFQVVVKEAGASNGAETRLVAGEPVTLPATDMKRVIAIQKSTRMSQRAGGRSTARDKGGKVGRLRAELSAQEIQRLSEWAKRREKALETAYIQCEVAHPGVCIQIGSAHITLDAGSKAARYSLDQETATLRVVRAAT